jgi:ElaB/YqjD/DUF883 family membrane-anchored ribosome-binding protein
MVGKNTLKHGDQEQSTPNTDQLLGDFKALMADAEALILATAAQQDGVIGDIREKALESLASVKESLTSARGPLSERVKHAAEGTDEFVHRNPWEAIGVAAGLGLLLGLIISRR